MHSYKSLCTEVYDIDKPDAPVEALNFYLHYAVQADGPILEPMCGSGRFLVPLVGRGFHVDGIDGSPQMLSACRDKCEARGLRPRLELQLLHEMELPRTYGLVFIPAGSFQLVTDMDEVRESLRRIHAALRPGGTFVFEVGQQRPTESSSWPWGGKRFKRPDGRGIIILSWLGHYDATTGIAHDIHRYELVIDGQLVRTEIEEYDLRHYAHAELRALLEESGFGEVRTMKRYSSDPPDEKDEDVVVECVRA